MTVGEFKAMFSNFPQDSMVTFGSSSYSRRPLVFYRTKIRDEKFLTIELTELILYPLDPDALVPEPEHEQRITVAEFMQHLNVDDDWQLAFAGTIDASGLELKAVVPAVAIDLVQPELPVCFGTLSR